MWKLTNVSLRRECRIKKKKEKTFRTNKMKWQIFPAISLLLANRFDFALQLSLQLISNQKVKQRPVRVRVVIIILFFFSLKFRRQKMKKYREKRNQHVADLVGRDFC